MIELKDANSNYAAFIVEVQPGGLRPLAGLDNLRALNVAGYQALVSKDTSEGDRFVAFVAGAQISETFAKDLNLHRDASLNADPEQTGYLEANRRVKAIRLRGHASNLLLVPVNAFGADLSGVRVGEQFDHINGVELVRKFVVPMKGNPNNGKAVKVHKSGVTSEQFPEHYDTPQWWRVQQDFEGRDVTVTQKAHGSSLRAGWVEVEREAKWYERLAAKVGLKADLRQWKFVVGSRRVIKTEGDGDHWYSTDIWTEYAKTHRLAEALPKGVIVYGELIGWTPDGAPIQPNYTYDLPRPTHMVDSSTWLNNRAANTQTDHRTRGNCVDLAMSETLETGTRSTTKSGKQTGERLTGEDETPGTVNQSMSSTKSSARDHSETGEITGSGKITVSRLRTSSDSHSNVQSVRPLSVGWWLTTITRAARFAASSVTTVTGRWGCWGTAGRSSRPQKDTCPTLPGSYNSADLYIYRVVVNGYDLSDAAMREFAAQRGLKVVPLLATFSHAEVAEGVLADFLEMYEDTKFSGHPRAFREAPVPLSEGSPCDEGVVIRAEGITPKAAKFKFPRFYEHESAAIDKGEVDIEDATS